ncbi:MAG TPA: hypothetical protein VIY47_12370, partial [Ignavibacteriaceae bacterium]
MKYNIKLDPILESDFEIIFPMIDKIWPHRVEDIKKDLQVYIRDPGDDRRFKIVLDETVIGITGSYMYDEHSAGLCWHGLLPKYQGSGISFHVIKMIFDLCKSIYKDFDRFVELIPVDRPELDSYFCSHGFRKTDEIVPKFYWLPDTVEWKLYSIDLKDM